MYFCLLALTLVRALHSHSLVTESNKAPPGKQRAALAGQLQPPPSCVCLLSCEEICFYYL